MLTLLPPANLNDKWVQSQTSKPRAPFTAVCDAMFYKAPTAVGNSKAHSQHTSETHFRLYEALQTHSLHYVVIFWYRI